MSASPNFHCGVIEGFYGQPWSFAQRRRLIAWMHERGLNTYLYAPKDDFKHRALWREPYGPDELSALAVLIGCCQQQQVEFVYAIAPGLDMHYATEQPVLRRKLAQMLQLGVRTFALLFDDIPHALRPEDAAEFGSFAGAHVRVANDVRSWLYRENAAARLWFCPTIYCGRFAEHRVTENAYLREVGANLAEAIEVLWTGPEIVSDTISVESVREIGAILRRPPLIWDNLHANDYDLRRLFLGPFAGRPQELRSEVRGILSNPNCEFEANFVPLHTLAAYARSSSAWDHRAALAEACAAWLPSFSCRPGRCFGRADLDLLVDLYYLPYAAGSRAEQLVADFEFLVRHPAAQWGEPWNRFQRTVDDIMELFGKITDLSNRELCFTFYRLMWELQAELKLMRGYLELRRTDPPAGARYTPRVHHDPRLYRGGVVARLQRLMPMDAPGAFGAD